ncbi:hypothetical protein CWI36_0415p0030 [Hamiltosporidium magnivora]|uniref:Uncharacterized protein n=1 Tax=Hamiltosporidium magnivora TaxID=148818 RepID=A0A4Q9LHX9_9MICR|nr:hypothetical protein CWI36_0415p0030 [Hamiltosporidium magnivora]
MRRKNEEVKEIVLKNIEKNKLQFNKISKINLYTDNTKILNVWEYSYNDFLIFINFMESFFLPVEKFFLRDFFQIISIFEYLEIELNWHLEKIIFILIYKLFSVLECDRKELKKEAFEIKKEFNLPLQFSEIICKKIKRIVFSENFYDEDFLKYNLFPLLTKEYTIEYLDKNLFFYTHPDIETFTYNYFDEENEKSFITNSDLCATVVVKNYIFVSDFDEKILKLIHLENSVSSQNGKQNLKTLKVDFFSIVAKQNLFSEVLSLNKIYEIEIEEYKIDKQKICKILNNNTILEFSFLTEETCDSLSLPFLHKSLKNQEKVYINGDHIYKILFLKNFIQFIATKIFKVVSIISKYSMKSCQNFDFDTDITENLCLGNNFPDGTIRNIFFKKRMIRLKTLSLYGFHIGKNDKKMLGNLENLISFDIINCFLLENSFSELFDEEKKYIIEDLVLNLVDITTNDVFFISKLKSLKNLTLLYCEFINKSFESLRGIYFERLEYYRFAAIDSCHDDAQIGHFTEEFVPNIFSQQTEELSVEA